jgi:hypothetical protein
MPLYKQRDPISNNEQLFHTDSSFIFFFGESSRSVAIVCMCINETFNRGIRLSLIDTLLLLLLLLYNSLNFVIPPLLFRFQNEKTPSRNLFYVYIEEEEEEDYCFPPERQL